MCERYLIPSRHAGFRRRFIKDFSKIAKLLTKLLVIHLWWWMSYRLGEAQNEIYLCTISAPDWPEPFEIMCDASNIARDVVLGKRVDNKQHMIYYSSRTLNDAQLNYTTTKKKFLVVVFALEKVCPYLLGTKTTIFTDHSALRYLILKKDTKARLIRWILLLQ